MNTTGLCKAVESEIVSAKAKTDVIYQLLETSLSSNKFVATLTAGEIRNILVLLGDVSSHIKKIDETLFAEPLAKAA